MTIVHASDCGGEGAPWCSPACVAASEVSNPAAALVNAQEGAALVGVTPRTIHRWADRGLVKRWPPEKRPLFLVVELLEVERRTRREPKGRPRSRRVA